MFSGLAIRPRVIGDNEEGRIVMGESKFALMVLHRIKFAEMLLKIHKRVGNVADQRLLVPVASCQDIDTQLDVLKSVFF